MAAQHSVLLSLASLFRQWRRATLASERHISKFGSSWVVVDLYSSCFSCGYICVCVLCCVCCATLALFYFSIVLSGTFSTRVVCETGYSFPLFALFRSLHALSLLLCLSIPVSPSLCLAFPFRSLAQEIVFCNQS